MESFDQIISHLTERIDKQPGRARGRSSNAKQNLMTGVRHLIAQLWKGSRIHEGYEAGINKRSGWYSENGRYRQAGLTYRQTFAAYEGLLNLGLIRETTTGTDRETFEGSITKFVLQMNFSKCLGIDDDPLKTIKPDPTAEALSCVKRLMGNGRKLII